MATAGVLAGLRVTPARFRTPRKTMATVSQRSPSACMGHEQIREGPIPRGDHRWAPRRTLPQTLGSHERRSPGFLPANVPMSWYIHWYFRWYFPSHAP